MQCNIW